VAQGVGPEFKLQYHKKKKKRKRKYILEMYKERLVKSESKHPKISYLKSAT
jgi:hypothetical protein